MKHITKSTKIHQALRLLALALLACLLATAMIGCSSAAKTAKLDEDEDESLWSLLEEVCKEMKEDGVSVKLSLENGWDESDDLDEDDLDNGEKAYSYVLTVKENGKKKGVVYIFAAVEKDSDTLALKGYRSVETESGYEEEYTDPYWVASAVESILSVLEE